MVISKLVAKYLTYKIKAFPYKRGWLKMDCPLCGGDFKMGYNPIGDIAHCFKCEYKGKGLELVKEMESVTNTTEALSVLRSLDLTGVSVEEFRPKNRVEPKTTLILPEGFRTLSRGKGAQRDIIYRYITRDRKIDPTIVTRAKVGYTSLGPYFGYVIFPIMEGKVVKYFQARLVNGFGAKFKNPTEEDTGVNKSFILYNSRILNRLKKVYIVESIINVLTLKLKAVAGLGKTFNRNLISMLIASPVEEFVLVLDPDAHSKAIQLGLALVNHKRIKILKLPEGEDVNDVGETFVYNLEHKLQYETYNSLITKKNEYKA